MVVRRAIEGVSKPKRGGANRSLRVLKGDGRHIESRKTERHRNHGNSMEASKNFDPVACFSSILHVTSQQAFLKRAFSQGLTGQLHADVTILWRHTSRARTWLEPWHFLWPELRLRIRRFQGFPSKPSMVIQDSCKPTSTFSNPLHPLQDVPNSNIWCRQPRFMGGP